MARRKMRGMNRGKLDKGRKGEKGGKGKGDSSFYSANELAEY